MRKKIDSFIFDFVNETKDYENKLDYLYKRNSGSYYTGYELAKIMVKELFYNIKGNISEKKILEPCVGTGIFVIAILEYLYTNNYKKNIIYNVINNLYVCESNKQSLMIYKKYLKKFCEEYLDVSLSSNYFKSHIYNYLSYDITELDSKYVPLSSYTNDLFDIIITNPPYKNLKLDSKDYNKDMSRKYKNYYSNISKDVKKRYKFSTEGVINIYKLFVEDIVCNYSTFDAYISLLIPSTILSDQSCEKLRGYLLENTNIKSILKLDEQNEFLDAQQSLCTMLIKKNEKTKKIKIKNYGNEKIYITDLDVLKKVQNSNSIFTLSEYEEKVLLKLSSFNKIKNLDFIYNYRGELDVTFYKNYYSSKKTNYPLIRGRNISEYFEILDDLKYVSEEFISLTPKRDFIKNNRIACQQISNINKEKRIQFAYVEKNQILANSCNFISVDKNQYNIDIYYLLGILNSNIINWYFKFFNSNNHVSNYEINEFPIPIEGNNIKKISRLTKKYLETKDATLLNKINLLADELYGVNAQLSFDDIDFIKENNRNKKNKRVLSSFYKDFKNIIPTMSIDTCEMILSGEDDSDTLLLNYKNNLSLFEYEVSKGLIDKYRKIYNNIILNHTTFKLSDLDMEMIVNVPQGGNWKDIPESTIKKSQRLVKISKSGGRTTLYGRIDYNKPAYTITTYFNRPGNGTYVHPTHNRVISVREAARIQSFDDSYYFYGNKTSLLKQVGNAVPVLLGMAIGKSIVEKTGLNKSLDLFCGAGGLTSGFKKAGIKSIMGTDFDNNACITFKINNTESKTLCADITKNETKDQIINYIKKHPVDIICGGPPCQGFSLAGKRFIDDPRNQLFKDYIYIVNEIRPKIVVMENVEGLLTFQNGEIYNQIINLYNKMDYKVEGKLLVASDYGVPQKRKRVIIIAVRNDLDISPIDLFPNKTTVEETAKVCAKDALKDLENIECSETAKYQGIEISKYTNYLLSEY